MSRYTPRSAQDAAAQAMALRIHRGGLKAILQATLTHLERPDCDYEAVVRHLGRALELASPTLVADAAASKFAKAFASDEYQAMLKEHRDEMARINQAAADRFRSLVASLNTPA